MSHKNRLILSVLGLLFLVGYIAVGTLVYHNSVEYAKEQNKKRLNNILMQQKSLHKYIEETMKPVLYNLKREGKLYSEFFDPKVLSFTYIARNVYANLKQQQTDNNLSVLSYKLATDNPRNEMNRATDKEIQILNRFRAGEIQNYSEEITEGDKRYIYYAKPVGPNKDSCMRCHSTPEKAPVELVQLYGPEKGFGEKVGNIRAMISLKVPFEQEYSEAMRFIKIINSMLLVFMVVLYGAIFYFFRKLDKKQQVIEAYNSELKVAAEHDGLTGALNRRSFDKLLPEMMENANLVMIMVDIDFFKKINDTHGHQVGDDILKEMARFIEKNIRQNDFLFRIGGEEFVIVSINQSMDHVVTMFDRLIRSVGDHDFGIGEAVHISAGIAQARPEDTFDTLYERTDRALYAAKEGGRNRYVVSD